MRIEHLHPFVGFFFFKLILQLAQIVDRGLDSITVAPDLPFQVRRGDPLREIVACE